LILFFSLKKRERKTEEQAKLKAILSRYDRKEDERELAELKRRQKEAREKADKEREVEALHSSVCWIFFL
jgi:hypothetical protein